MYSNSLVNEQYQYMVCNDIGWRQAPIHCTCDICIVPYIRVFGVVFVFKYICVIRVFVFVFDVFSSIFKSQIGSTTDKPGPSGTHVYVSKKHWIQCEFKVCERAATSVLVH